MSAEISTTVVLRHLKEMSNSQLKCIFAGLLKLNGQMNQDVFFAIDSENRITARAHIAITDAAKRGYQHEIENLINKCGG